MPHLNCCSGLRKGESTALSNLRAVIDQDTRDGSGIANSSVRDEDTQQGDECNFVLISSDGVPFKIQRYHLMSHSPIFRDMITISSEMGSKGRSKSKNNEIQLCDNETETSEVVSTFINLISGEPLVFPEDSTDLARYSAVHPFLVKYEAKLALERLRLNLHRWARDHPKISISNFFVCGSKMDYPDLMVCALEEGNRWYYVPDKRDDNSKETQDRSKAEPSTRPVWKGVVNGRVLDIASMSYYTFCKIKDNHKFALLRSLKSIEGGPSTREDWVAVGKKFREFVVELEKY